MSTIPKRPRRPPKRVVDPYFFGWREEWHRRPNGRPELVLLPLTEEDVLHPRERDHIVNSDVHGDDVGYLHGAFKIMLSAIAGALVLSDVGIYWDDRSL